jgi:hypothetical protein
MVPLKVSDKWKRRNQTKLFAENVFNVVLLGAGGSRVTEKIMNLLYKGRQS